MHTFFIGAPQGGVYIIIIIIITITGVYKTIEFHDTNQCKDM